LEYRAVDRDLSALTDATGLHTRPAMAAAIRVLQEYDRTGRII
jgi:hypothetical protein